MMFGAFQEDAGGLRYDEIPLGDGMGRFQQELDAATRILPVPEDLPVYPARPASPPPAAAPSLAAPALTALSPALHSLRSPSPAPPSLMPALAPPSAMPANPEPGLVAPDFMALTGNGHGSNGAADNQVESEEDLRARVAGNLAMGLARILVAAIRDLESPSVQEREQLVATVQDQRQKLDAALTALGEVRAKVEIELAQGMASLREADAQHDAILEGLKSETQDRIDALMGRLQLQQEELSSLRISPRVASVVERLDRQADAIKAIFETGVRREVLLDELSGVLAKLKANWNVGVKMPAEL